MSAAPAHVFVCRGDLMHIACDAWLVPGGHGPGGTWREALPPKTAWRRLADDERAVLLADVPEREPLPVLTDVTGSNRHGPEWYVDGARHFMRVAVRELRRLGRKPKHGRARHLLALPLLGTGGGGGELLSGEVVRLLLPVLQDEAARVAAEGTPVDVVLVLKEGPAHAAAQTERLLDEDAAFGALPKALRAQADALAERARRGELVLFLGAGVSRPAGLPSWDELLRLLARERMPGAVLDDLQRLSELDRAALVQRRLQPGETMGGAVAALLKSLARRHSLGHALLANLPVDEVVTTNYDDLFEHASLDVERPCKVIPGQPVARGERFILKMHGCVSRPHSIVLTREDYLKFQENRTALAGIVQALLLTRHMLFVGFGFSDDDFHRIAHAVRGALRGDQGPARRAPFGTNLVVGDKSLVRELWADDLDWVALLEHANDAAEQARLAEVFLDRLAARSVSATAHLGDSRYEAVLTPGERALRDRIDRFVEEATPEERATAAWGEVERLRERLGLSDDPFSVLQRSRRQRPPVGTRP
ncbi:MAG: hypothetical protein A2138_05095 [Deltaproteobacteria bacterium RBG_16_71_12]|nr:MAG: hypothetical protein A2138_05095 [Deltaproteobacteria bacterium RBG_16_71_12]